jgi:hypothetical protein
VRAPREGGAAQWADGIIDIPHALDYGTAEGVESSKPSVGRLGVEDWIVLIDERAAPQYIAQSYRPDPYVVMPRWRAVRDALSAGVEGDEVVRREVWSRLCDRIADGSANCIPHRAMQKPRCKGLFQMKAQSAMTT